MTHAAAPQEARYSDVVHHANANPSVSYVARKTGIGYQEAARLLEMALQRGDLASGDYNGRRLELHVEDGTRALAAEIERLQACVLELEADVAHKDAYAEQLGRKLALATAHVPQEAISLLRWAEFLLATSAPMTGQQQEAWPSLQKAADEMRAYQKATLAAEPQPPEAAHGPVSNAT